MVFPIQNHINLYKYSTFKIVKMYEKNRELLHEKEGFVHGEYKNHVAFQKHFKS